mmetsp:Transcript_43709/g.95149  ORF Transcript_43709/g.95149 Transcript_43709/m.95149 type:complete len:243 (+) Transcript_43709:259-987(+)
MAPRGVQDLIGQLLEGHLSVQPERCGLSCQEDRHPIMYLCHGRAEGFHSEHGDGLEHFFACLHSVGVPRLPPIVKGCHHQRGMLRTLVLRLPVLRNGDIGALAAARRNVCRRLGLALSLGTPMAKRQKHLFSLPTLRGSSQIGARSGGSILALRGHDLHLVDLWLTDFVALACLAWADEHWHLSLALFLPLIKAVEDNDTTVPVNQSSPQATRFHCLHPRVECAGTSFEDVVFLLGFCEGWD